MTELSGARTTDSASAVPLLIDRYLPDFDVTRIEHVVVDADVATTWQALVDLDLMRVHSPLTDAALFVRGLPERFPSRRRHTPSVEPPTELKLLDDEAGGLEGWMPLGHRPGHEVAIGAIGRFWQPDIDWYDVTDLTPADFAGFAHPGWGRIAASFSLRPYGEPRALVSYEARTATPDADSQRRFARYWRVINPVVGHIMRATLDTLAADARARSGR
jgi:hypothetical protein